MNKIFSLALLPLMILSCIGKHQSEAQKVMVKPTTALTINVEVDTLNINIAESKIDWIATGMRGSKRRTGIISFKHGYFLTSNSKQIVGGKFIVDMETMDVTNIPIHEKIARKNLIDHLKSDDFFNVAIYPESTLEVTSVEELKTDSLKISGNLSIREITKNITFLTAQKDNYFTTNFTFNRLEWSIAYEGSWTDKTLVDKEVELKILISID